MLKSTLASTGVAALAGAAMLTLSMTAPASAFTLASPSLAAPVAAQHVDKVWWDRWGRWHGGWGYRRHCWRGYYGRLHCGW